MGGVSIDDALPFGARENGPAGVPISQALPARESTPRDMFSSSGRDIVRADLSEATSRAEGLQGALNRMVVTPVQDAVAGIAATPDLLLEQLPAFLVNFYREKVGDERGPIEATDILPSFEEISSAIQNLTGLRRVEAESSFGKIMQMGVTALLAGLRTPKTSTVSGGTSELAGQLAEGQGPRAEMIARITGALAPFGARAAGGRVRKDPSDTVRADLDALSDEQLADVMRIMENGQRLGTPVTVAEAMAQVGGGKSSLKGQRAVESGKSEGSVAEVQQRIDARGDVPTGPDGRTPGTQRQALEQVVPPASRPGSQIGTGAQDAADAAIQGERNFTNAITRPLYQRVEAAGNVIAPARLDGIMRRHPSIESAIQGVRSAPTRRGGLDALPDSSPAVLDAARKRLRGIADTADQAGDADTASIAASAAEAIDGELSASFTDYLIAQQVQAARRANIENPLRAGPMGKVSDTPELRAQYAKVFQDPLSADPRQVRELITGLMRADSQLAEDFVNFYLTQAFNKVAKGGTVDTASRAGGRFVDKVVGESGMQDNLIAALESLPDGANRARAVQELLEVFSAQSKRLAAGSQTAEKTADIASRSSGPVQSVVEVATSPFTGIPGFLRDFRYNKNIQEMADILLLPADQINDIVTMSNGLLQGAAVQGAVTPNVGQQ